MAKEKPVDMELFFEGLTLMRHRGPDGFGILGVDTAKRTFKSQFNPRRIDAQRWGSEANLALGHRRLSILDVSDRSLQPMRSPSGRYFITYNGELYNYKILKRHLNEYEYVTSSDTEVLLHAFEKWGVAAVDKLVGMFAFVVYDSKLNRLYCVRDHFGVKPLYVMENGGYFAIASEIKAFFGIPDFQMVLSIEELLEYRYFRYLAKGATLWRDVEEVLPGHYLEFDLSTGEKISKRWWRLEPEDVRYHESVYEDYLSRLNDSVKMQMVSDVPVGTQLSAGLDSSVITYLASQETTGKLSSFTIGFQESDYDESELAGKFANVLNIDHNVLTLSSGTFLNRLKDVTWYFEQPLNHPNSVGVYMLAELAQPIVTVLLSGEGADEILAGYRRRYVFSKWLPLFRKGGSFLYPILRHLRNTSKGKNIARFSALSRFSLDDANILNLAYGWDDSVRDTELLPTLLGSSGFEKRREILQESPFLDSVTRSQYYDIHTYLPELLLRQDKLCMGASIENRVPFLDHNLVRWAMSIEPRYRLHFNTGKWVLRKAVRDKIPEFILKQPKRGFSIPLARWFNKNDFQKQVSSLPPLSHQVSNILGEDLSTSATGASDSFENRWIRMAFRIWQKEFQKTQIIERLQNAEHCDVERLNPGEISTGQL